jgi:hypothetical protein
VQGQRGVDDLIKAWGIVEAKYPNAKVLVGPIEERDSISGTKRKYQEILYYFTDFM